MKKILTGIAMLLITLFASAQIDTKNGAGSYISIHQQSAYTYGLPK